MAPAMQISSLSSITELAANPPEHPRNPTLPQHEALVLYIARVPGSKDIVLTPMKPGLKNLTAGDVDSSLYYLHLDLPSDRLLVEDVLREDFEDLKVQSKTLEPLVKRKPLNGAPLIGQTLQPDRLPGQLNNPQDAKLSTSEKAAGTNSVAPYVQEFSSNKIPSSRTNNVPIPRRPLGPRPLSSVQQKDRTQALAFPSGENERKVSNNSSTISTTGAPSRSLPNYGTQAFDNPSRVMATNATNHFGCSTVERHLNEELSITLIRRDPTSGAQWNIGRITCSTHLSADISTSMKPSEVVTVHISAPGYNRFQISPVVQLTDGISTSVTERASQYGFDRQVLTTGSSTLFSTGSNLSAKEHLAHNQSSRLRLKNCHFISPWNGRCEFSTGSGGRSLKCKHQLPGNDQLGSRASLTVSELRFNLPSSDLFKSSNSTNKSQSSKISAPKVGQTRSSLSSGSSSAISVTKPDPTSYAAMYPSDQEDEDSEDDHFGLSLGREKAGGGNRGKRAKLGKLIVHDEGLKMLDLVVAANMGIWWRTWQG